MGRVLHSCEAEEQEEALELILSYAGVFESIQDIYNYYHHLVSEAVSDSRKQVLDIILKGLSKSTEYLRIRGPDHDSYVRSPFSHAVATLLMDHSADLNAEDNFRCTPLDVLFHHNPPFLYEEKEAKKMMIATFNKGRNDIYKALKERGGEHRTRVVDMERIENDLPRPES